MRKTVQALPLLNFQGSPSTCGQEYGDQERENILGFFSSQIRLRADELEFAEKCWACLREEFPEIAEFCVGLAAGADLTIGQVILLLLHEEIVHVEHCSIIGVSREGSSDGQSFIAQNWDWPATVYGWPKIVRLECGSLPATLTYSFPGLWACAGVNEAGLAVGWSGAGYWPSVQPTVGIPTYALIAGLLIAPDVPSAIQLLGRRSHAGCFILFLADRTGELAIVEAWPKNLAIQRNERIALRTNHYLTPQAVEATHQVEPYSILESTTAQRLDNIRSLVGRETKMDINAAQKILCHPGVRATYKIEDVQGCYNSMTLDSFCMNPCRGELSVARGLPDRHAFVRYSLDPPNTDLLPSPVSQE